jgi:hypothetical protein
MSYIITISHPRAEAVTVGPYKTFWDALSVADALENGLVPLPP